jgi:hypothetical protein
MSPITITPRKEPMKRIQINFGKGWENTVYEPMTAWDAYIIAERLEKIYTNYSYRVVDACVK